jgi:hypothetical protein
LTVVFTTALVRKCQRIANNYQSLSFKEIAFIKTAVVVQKARKNSLSAPLHGLSGIDGAVRRNPVLGRLAMAEGGRNLCAIIQHKTGGAWLPTD